VTDAGTTQPRSRSERLLRQTALLAEFHQQLDQLGNDGRVRIEHHNMVGTLSFLEYALIRAGTAQSIMGAFLAFKGLRKTAVKTKTFARGTVAHTVCPFGENPVAVRRRFLRTAGCLVGFFFFGPEPDSAVSASTRRISRPFGQAFHANQNALESDSLPLFAGNENWQIWRKT
jgi:hypothetical protein